jgi:hypothetical protein
MDKYETVSVNFSDEQIIYISLEAHKRNITFNKMVNKILREQIQKEYFKICVRDNLKNVPPYKKVKENVNKKRKNIKT